jgi:hypothetical protein
LPEGDATNVDAAAAAVVAIDGEAGGTIGAGFSGSGGYLVVSPVTAL